MRVGCAHRAAKSLRSTHREPSTYAVCQAAKWLKSSVERRSGNSERTPIRGSLSLHNGAQWHLLGASRYQETCHSTRTATFQTVSRRGILRSSCGPFVLCRTHCSSAHNPSSHRSMLPLLRGQLTPREGAGQLPVLLLDLGSLPTNYLPRGRNASQLLLRGKRYGACIQSSPPRSRARCLSPPQPLSRRG